MNESGGPVASLRDFFSVPIAQLVVIHDELDLQPGKVRVKQGGGSAAEASAVMPAPAWRTLRCSTCCAMNTPSHRVKVKTLVWA